MKTEVYKCDHCGDIIKDDCDVIKLKSIVISKLDGTVLVDDMDRDLCGQGCTLQFINSKLNPDAVKQKI